MKIPNNPTDLDRHLLLKNALKSLYREEDLDSIIKLTSPPKEITTIAKVDSFKDIKVGIIGGGLAGLSSAYELKKLGFDITILEANKSRIGGRIYTYYFTENLYGEFGSMRIPVGHETVWHYINKFKLNTNAFIKSSENDILYVKNVRIKGLNNEDKIMKYIYPKFKLTATERKKTLTELTLYAYNSPLLNILKEVREYLLKIRKVYPYEINYFDSIDVFSAFKALNLSQGAIDLLSSSLGIDRGLYSNSYLEMLREIYLANFVYTYEIEGGLYKLPLAFYNSFKNDQARNVKYKSGCKVTGIYYDKDFQKVKIKYFNFNTNKITIDSFDYVVCAIPFSTLRVIDIYPLFSSEKMQAIKDMNYDHSQKTLMYCKERFWENKTNKKIVLGGNVSTDLPITSVFYPSRNNSKEAVITASYNIGLDSSRVSNLDEEYRVYYIKRELEKVHGLNKGYLDDIILETKTVDWTKDVNSLGAFCMYNTCQNEFFTYYSIKPEYNNRVFFSGEHISTFHGWAQGALQTGMIAANSIAKICKIRNANS